MIDWDVPDHRRPTQLALTGENGPIKARKAVQVSGFLDFPLYSLYIPFTLCKGNMKENRCFEKTATLVVPLPLGGPFSPVRAS